MKKITNKKDKGASLVEYVLLIALIALVSMTAIPNLASNSGKKLIAAQHGVANDAGSSDCGATPGAECW